MEGTILFVDEDPLSLSIIGRTLKETSYEGKYAATADEALEILQESPVDVLVTNLRLPAMDGVDLLKIVKVRHPFVTRVVLTGYLHVHSIMAAINHGEVFRFLTKPLPVYGQFMKVLDDSVQRSKSLQDNYRTVLSVTGDIFRAFDCEFICVDEDYHVLDKSITITAYEKGENVASEVTFSKAADFEESKQTVHLDALGPMKAIRSENEYGHIHFFFRASSF
ncbi:response regulator [Salimicrobium sp. PL1-032A]|uniref:response regulator n=1 Tax=Salimicrobium sp. PL1-032A TaxID=3095364 RepID=UPI0032615120